MIIEWCIRIPVAKNSEGWFPPEFDDVPLDKTFLSRYKIQIWSSWNASVLLARRNIPRGVGTMWFAVMSLHYHEIFSYRFDDTSTFVCLPLTASKGIPSSDHGMYTILDVFHSSTFIAEINRRLGNNIPLPLYVSH